MLEIGLKTLLSLPCLWLGKLLIMAALIGAAKQSFSINSMAFGYFVRYHDVCSNNPSNYYQSN
jgi:hypothetical protein